MQISEGRDIQAEGIAGEKDRRMLARTWRSKEAGASEPRGEQ